ncbi:MAG: AmmeMemoRadiSam system protein B [Candidatus Promineifilaceae bacterium]
MSVKPRIRPIDLQPIQYEGQQMWLLRDPLELKETQLVVTQPLAQLLTYCDGTRDPVELQSALAKDFGVPINYDIIADMLDQLDDACLLDNERSREAMRSQLAEYRKQPSREPALAGPGYPADPFELTSEFLAYGEQDDLTNWKPWTGRGIISPHIDYPRGGEVYSQVWNRAEIAVKRAEIVIIFGTDHNGGDGSITLTTKPYATPFGLLPIDHDIVDALAGTIGQDAFAEELHHRKEHSIELSATWLHYINNRQPTPMIPILCGSFHSFIKDGRQPEEDHKIASFTEKLRELTAGKRVLAVASVDLAHLGPNFGDDFAMDVRRRERLIQEDRMLIDAISEGDERRFFQQIAAVEDGNRICGLSSIYMLLRFLGPTAGEMVSYTQCPADQQNASLVSICGVLLQ